MGISAADLRYLIPEIIISLTAIILLFIELIVRERYQLLKTIIAFLVGLWALFFLVNSPLSTSETLFSGLIAIDGLSIFFRILFIVAGGLTLLIAFKSSEISSREYGETLILILVSVVFMSLLAQSTNLLMIYLSLEGVSLISYILVANRVRYPKASEAGLKYAIFGGVASGVMVYGMSLLYGFSGSLDLTQLNIKIFSTTSSDALIFIAVVMVLVGFGYKIAMVPFHMWAPDVYEAAPTPITGFLSVAPKAAGFAILVRFLYTTLVSQGTLASQAMLPPLWAETLFHLKDFPWEILFFVLAVVTMTLGNLAALNQQNVKRLLAYSSIAHAGYLLMGLTITDWEGVRAVLVYLPIYIFMNLGAFSVVQSVNRWLGSEDISIYKGLGRRAPFISVLFSIFLFSLTGIPPTAGFIGKFYIFTSVLKYSNSFYLTLVLIGVINTVVSLFYYTRIIRFMFLEEGATTSPVFFPNYDKAVLLILTLPVLIWGVYWTPLIRSVEYFLRVLY